MTAISQSIILKVKRDWRLVFYKNNVAIAERAKPGGNAYIAVTHTRAIESNK